MRALVLMLALAASACSSTALPVEPPPLADMEEPLDLRSEPADDVERRAMPAGSFSGVYVDDARDTLAAKLDQPGQLRVARIVENSPAAAAGLAVDDLLLEVQAGDASPQPLSRASEWRRIELETPPGTKLVLVVDRAGREARTELTLVPRLQPAERTPVAHFREEQRVGVVVRTPTEVEARKAGLGPGGGAVVIGLSQRSPWRSAGVRFRDLVVAVDGRAVAHPQDLLAVIRDAEGDKVTVELVRDSGRLEVVAPFSQRETEVRDVTIPLLFQYATARGRTEWSVLYGLFGYQSTATAWQFELLWWISFGGGDADRLVEVPQ